MFSILAQSEMVSLVSVPIMLALCSQVANIVMENLK